MLYYTTYQVTTSLEKEPLMKHKVFFLFIIMSSTITNGCSVGMAMSGKKDPNLSVCKIGADRATVELQIGNPIYIATSSKGNTIAYYEYQHGNEPSPGRASLHAVLDIASFCAWEIIATPIEGFTGNRNDLTIEYSKSDKILSINNPIIIAESNELEETEDTADSQ